MKSRGLIDGFTCGRVARSRRAQSAQRYTASLAATRTDRLLKSSREDGAKSREGKIKSGTLPMQRSLRCQKRSV